MPVNSSEPSLGEVFIAHRMQLWRVARKIVNTAKTALGGDNRTGCGVLATLAAELVRQ